MRSSRPPEGHGMPIAAAVDHNVAEFMTGIITGREPVCAGMSSPGVQVGSTDRSTLMKAQGTRFSGTGRETIGAITGS